jgi:hypothetical protein
MKNDVLRIADKSIELVEQKLSEIAELTDKHNELSAKLEELKQSETSILEAPGKNRVERLLKARAEIDCVTADLQKSQLVVAAAKDSLYPLCATANNDLHAFRDALVVEKKAVVTELLLQAWEPKAIKHFEGWIGYSIPVRNLDMTRLFFMRERPDQNVAAASKLRGQLKFLVTGKVTAPIMPQIAAPVIVPEQKENSLGSLL